MKNILICGASGTGKTIISRAIPYYVGYKKTDIKKVMSDDILSNIKDINQYVESEFVEYIQVHASMTYEDLIYGIDVSSVDFSIQYAEKRVKKLCDRAISSSEQFFIILDDICRTNAGKLLGNLLYAIEYRNQPVCLVDGSSLIVPDNVTVIVTECKNIYGNSLEYAIRRRFDYVIELPSDVNVLDRYYTNYLSSNTKAIVLDIYESAGNFVKKYLLDDVSVQKDAYLPGHGMLMVERTGTENDILEKILLKIHFQLLPYIRHLMLSGILKCGTNDIEILINQIDSQLSIKTLTNVHKSSVSKMFCRQQTAIPNFDLQDSYYYYTNTIIPNVCKEYRGIIEHIIDAIFTNGVFEPEKALSGILTNTNVIRFENRNRPGEYAAFVVESSQNMDYGYITTSSNNVRSYYSSNNSTKGRWASQNDAPEYKVTFSNGTSASYISLNALRNVGFDTSKNKIHAEGNTASIYCALYHLVKTYLSVYETNLKILLSNDNSYSDLYNLVCFENQYWDCVNVTAKKLKSNDDRLKALAGAAVNIKSLWTKINNDILVDDLKFTSMIQGNTAVDKASYEDLYNLNGQAKSITIKGVGNMIDLNNYQQIMENIGVHQMIFQGPPGTSKTFESQKFVLKQLNPASSIFAVSTITPEQISNELKNYKLTEKDYDDPTNSPKLISGGWDLVQFHPSYGYEDFIRGIEVKPNDSGVPTYAAVNRILGKIAEFAKIAEKAASAAPPKFYLIVDEINRANLATVFGELIYGLEYRNSSVSTPYEVMDKSVNTVSKDIVLGKNLFIIGTMNTADKSIDSIDYAIRRRFLFIDSPAQRETVINCYNNVMNVSDEDAIEVLLFDAIGFIFEGTRFFNEEYQRSDVRIGHTYFLRKRNAGYNDTMTERLIFQIIPILREYVKDGILDSFEDLKSIEHSANDIVSCSAEKRVEAVGENIMLYVKHFGEFTNSGQRIDNSYIAGFVDDLCNQLGY